MSFSKSSRPISVRGLFAFGRWDIGLRYGNDVKKCSAVDRQRDGPVSIRRAGVDEFRFFGKEGDKRMGGETGEPKTAKNEKRVGAAVGREGQKKPRPEGRGASHGLFPWEMFRADQLGAGLILVLEGKAHPGAIGGNPSVFHLHVELVDLRDAKILERLAGGVHGAGRGFLPGCGAGSDQFDDFVNAFAHGVAPFGERFLKGADFGRSPKMNFHYR